ncbi:MAG: 3-hydroxybutyryl-CoA dehydratase [Clostridia bacterium]|jgi:3-hydroxybutyryl-CoA dehydratase|nr:3-hydroxybutyryl-CoA dehydratase [Clostridia bacterium]
MQYFSLLNLFKFGGITMIEFKAFAEIKIGDEASYTKQITDDDIQMFAKVTGDVNPVHLDSEYAKKTIFKEKIAHGMISAGLISAVLGTKLPGPGTIYLSQEIKFVAPVFINDVLTAIVSVIEKDDIKRRLKLKTYVENQHGKVVSEGMALVMVK